MEYYHSEQVMQRALDVEEDRRMWAAFNGLGGKLKVDGNQWCAITGEMPENYLAGFAETPAAAMYEWWAAYFSQKAQNYS